MAGGIRTQYGHCIDVLPTALALAGLGTPADRNGKTVKPMNGASSRPMRARFVDLAR